MGDFTYAYHEELDPVRLIGAKTGKLTFANGDTVEMEGFAIAENSGLSKDGGVLASMTEILHFTSGSGRFARGIGSLIVQRSQNIITADYAVQTETYGSFRGYYIASAPGNGEEVAALPGGESADAKDSSVLVCDNGRERIIPGFRVYQYLDRHPGSYLGHCGQITAPGR